MRKKIKSILDSLDIKCLLEEGDKLLVEVPPYRVDVTREADIIEEILRIYGYNNVDFSEKLNSSISYQKQPDNEKLINAASDFLSDNGFTEIMSNSLTKSQYYDELSTLSSERLVPMLNPLSQDLNVMRQTLLFGGLESISRNINHKNPNLRLYEYGRIYFLNSKDLSETKSFDEFPVLGLFLTGNKEEQSWTSSEEPVSFFELKAYYTNLLAKLGVTTRNFKTNDLEAKNDIFSGGIEYFLGKKSVLRAGSIHSEILKKFDIEQEVFFAEISWKDLLPLMSARRTFQDLPKFPEVRRDLALLLDEKVTYKQIEQLSYRSAKDLLTRVELFDYFKGKTIPAGKKSYAVSFFLQDLKKTLTDKEIDRIMARIVQSLANELQAELR